MASKSIESKKSKAELVSENLKLKSEVKKLKSSKRRMFARNSSSWALIFLATLILIIGNLFFWTSSTVINNTRFINTVGPIIKQPAVQTALSQYTTDQLFKVNNVQGYVQQVLPPRATFLAPQLTSQLKSVTNTVLTKVIQTNKFQTYWINTLDTTHEHIISFAKKYKGNGTITVNDVYSRLSKGLTNTKLSFLANKQLPSKVSSIKITTVAWLPILSTFINHLTLYKILSLLLFIIICFLAIYLNKDRRKAVIKLSLSLFLGMILTLVCIKVAKAGIINSISSNYQAAVSASFNIVFKEFIEQTRIIALLTLLIIFIAWISSQYKSAKYIKNKTSLVFSGKVQSVIFPKENEVTRFVYKNQKLLRLLSVSVIVLLIILFNLTIKLFIFYIIILVLVFILINILAIKPVIKD